MHDVSILYWSKEHLGMKPITGITHLAARRMSGAGLPEAVIVTRQVYASHYKNASITVTALVHDNGTRFLVYLHRSQIDAFDGLVGRMIRRTVESRVRREAPGVLTNLRQRLETGDPLPR